MMVLENRREFVAPGPIGIVATVVEVVVVVEVDVVRHDSGARVRWKATRRPFPAKTACEIGKGRSTMVVACPLAGSTDRIRVAAVRHAVSARLLRTASLPPEPRNWP